MFHGPPKPERGYKKTERRYQKTGNEGTFAKTALYKNALLFPLAMMPLISTFPFVSLSFLGAKLSLRPCQEAAIYRQRMGGFVLTLSAPNFLASTEEDRDINMPFSALSWVLSQKQAGLPLCKIRREPGLVPGTNPVCPWDKGESNMHQNVVNILCRLLTV